MKPTTIHAPVHPIAQRVRRLAWVTVIFALFSGLSFYFELVACGVSFALLSAFYVWVTVTLHRNGRAVSLHNMAFERATRGDLDEAEALSAQIPEHSRRKGFLALAHGLLHALIAMQRGRFEEGVREATRSIEVKSFKIGKEQYVVSAFGVRALLLAMLGRESEALRDVARVEGSRLLHPTPWARCVLAKAILASKDDARREELVGLLRQGRRAIESLTPRERVLFRALERLVRVDARGAYREQGTRVEQADAGGLAAWVSRIVPDAGNLVPEGASASSRDSISERDEDQPYVVHGAHPRAMRDAASASMESIRRTAEKKGKHQGAARSIALWVVLSGIVYSALRLAGILRPSPVASDIAEAATESSWTPSAVSWIPAGLLVLILLWTVERLRTQTKVTSALAAAAMLRATGKDVEYMEAMRGLTKSRVPTLAAESHRGLAVLHEERGAFEDALAETDKALALLWASPQTRLASHDMQLPEIVASRAFLLGVLGRVPEAQAEYEGLLRDYPAFPFRTRAKIRIEVALALRAGDEPMARKVAQQRTMDLPLMLRDELLYDLLDLAANPMPSRAELARMNEEFAHAPHLVQWVDRVAPGLRTRALRGEGARVVASPEMRVASSPDAHERDEHDTALATERGAV